MKKTMLKSSVLSISLLSLSVTAASPALADISNAFPNASPNTISLILSLPALLMIPTTLLCGKISNYIRKTRLLSFGLILFIIGGVGPIFCNNLNSILFLRGIFGIGLGFIGTLAAGLIADFFEGEERGTMMGLQSAVVNIGSIITTLVAGFLSTINWHYTFLVYLLGVGVLLLTFFKLPEPEKVHIKGEEKESLGLSIYKIAFLFIFYSLLLFSFFTNIAMVINSENLGNAASAGIVLTTMTVGGLIAGIIFGRVSKLLKNNTIFISMSLTGIGFLMLSHPLGLNMILLESLIIGIGFGTTMPAIMIKVSTIAPKTATTFALAVITSAMGVGQFISPFVLRFVGKIIGNESLRSSFLVSGVGILTCALIWLIMSMRPQKLEDNIFN